MDEREREKLYEQEKGPLTLAVYKAESEVRYSCCWERVESGHNAACRKHVAAQVDEQPSLI